MATQLTRKHATAAGILLVLCAIVFLYFAQSQETDQTQPEDSPKDNQPTVADRAPEGYRVPERDPVITPFTNVSAENLRLTNIRSRPYDDADPASILSPDGQWRLFRRKDLLITRTDGSNEKRTLRKREHSGGDSRVYFDDLFWSWDSKRIFYRIGRYFERASKEEWVESVDIETGEITSYPEIGYHDDLHSLATARYPDDPVIHYDYDNKVISVSTKDGTKRWVIGSDGLISLSPNKRMVLAQYWRNSNRYIIYAVDGSGVLYEFNRGDGLYHEWSPDSTKFLYEVLEVNAGGVPTVSDIYIMNIDGTGRKQLTNTTDTVELNSYWSDDGTSIIFSTRDGRYIADLAVE